VRLVGKEPARDQCVGYLPGFPDAAGQSSITVHISHEPEAHPKTGDRGHAAVRGQGDRGRGGRHGAGDRLGDPRSCGRGCKGHRDYAWAWAWGTASPQHWVLIRRSLSDQSDLAFFYCHAPEGRPVSLPTRASSARDPCITGNSEVLSSSGDGLLSGARGADGVKRRSPATWRY
jgi:hypothetical protein